MYFLDPQRGRRRRFAARGKLARIRDRTAGAVGATSRELRQRAYEIIAGTRSLVSRQRVSDEVVAERVRARLSSLVSNASAIQVWSEGGRVSLSGRIAGRELWHLLRGVESIRGVAAVENFLTVVEEASGSVPRPYEAGRARSRRVEELRDPWTGVSRLLLGASGGVLAIGSAISRNVGGGAVAVIGISMLAAVLGAIRYLWHVETGEAERTDDGLPHHNGAHHNGHAFE
jgi:hypothetical protein